ncbi:MAG: M56 family metallopeptidase [Thermoguttaceae bacterium]
MNAIGIALVWCVVQVTLIGLLAAGVYLIVRRLRPAAAASVPLTSLAIVVVLSLMVLSPWPRWTIGSLTASTDRAAQAVPETLPDIPFDTQYDPPLDQERLEIGASIPSEEQQATVVGVETASSKSLPSSFSLVWQAITAELCTPPTAATTSGWHWPAMAAVLLLSAMACGLGWLVLGVMAVRWQRLRSRPVADSKLLELIDRLRAELECQRPVEARQSDDLATAATIGWQRPVVLLPADWTSWTADQRRAVLAHEIAHARSHDFLALLFGQVGLVLHFYHPLLHWLMGRLRLEYELAADAAAASVSGGQRQYLRTIAELALHRQDRPLLWPARTFLPTRTTFLRRIAMLRDSKLRFDRLSPVTRLITVGAMLLCGLLVAGLRGPSGSVAATAADTVQTAVADDSIDTTYMIEKASLMVVMRPAAVFARPELAALAKLLEQSGNMVPPGTRLADFRQITVIMPEADISGPREIVVLQWVKPIAEAELVRQLADKKYTVKELNGKKMYIPSTGGTVVLLCDEYTEVEVHSEQLIGIYLAGKLGVLPKWLPAKAWELFRADHVVIAADAVMMRREMKPLVEHSPPLYRAALLPISSLCENINWLGLGAKLNNQFAAHALAAAKDADASANVLRTAEAFKTLLEIAAKNARTDVDAHQQSGHVMPRELFDAADRLLDNAKLKQDGNDVHVDSSVEMDGARLNILVSAVNAAGNARRAAQDPSTKQGMMALVEDFFEHNFRDVTSRETMGWGEVAKTKEGNFSIRYKYRAKIWNGEPRIINQVFTFDPKGQFVSVNDAEKRTPAPPARVYQVGKKISDFPEREDLSTPEAAFASIYHAYVAEGDAAWPRLSVPSLANLMQQGVAKQPLPKELADWNLNATIVEVHVWGATHAAVISEVTVRNGTREFHVRELTRVNGRWLNEGENTASSIEKAREQAAANANALLGAAVGRSAGGDTSRASKAVAAAPHPPATSPATSKVIEALARAAEAGPRVRSVHIVAEMRTRPGDNFSFIDAGHDFVPLNIWKQFGDKPKWRVENSGRVAVMDGDSTVMLMGRQTVVKVPRAAESAFDTYWLLALASSKEIIAREFRAAVAKGWDVKRVDETSAGGEKEIVVTIEAKSGLPDGDYLKNKFFFTADRRCVYRFDAKTLRLEGFDAYLHQSGGDVKIFTIGHIEYDQPIDPKVFTLQIPKTAQEYKEPQRLPNNEKYEKMTPLETARAFFQACGKEDWDEVGKFYQPLNDNMKKYLGGLTIVHLGEPFKPLLYGGWMVPYEIKFKDGRTRKWNLAVRNDNPAKHYVVDGGL